jgi:hypothetical protein
MSGVMQGGGEVTARRTGAVLATLGGVYLVMLTVARLAIIPRIGPDGTGEVWLWVWFLVCVVAAALLAGWLGGVGVGRGLVSGAGFLVTFVLIGPFLASAFAYYLPDRPVVFGPALGVQLVILLPRRGPWAPVWRVALPVAGDLVASLFPPPGGGARVVGLTAIAAALVAVWLLERRHATAAEEG